MSKSKRSKSQKARRLKRKNARSEKLHRKLSAKEPLYWMREKA